MTKAEKLDLEKLNAPAYVVFHDSFDGAMEIWPSPDFKTAKYQAGRKQDRLDSMGYENCGVWRAYLRLPRKKIWRIHNEQVKF